MLYAVLILLWAWGTFLPPASAEAVPPQAMQQLAESLNTHTPAALRDQHSKRQDIAQSVCRAYGIDFQDGRNYFVDQRSAEPFQAVTQFEGCNQGTADVLLVDRRTSKQYDCGQIPTTPDLTPRMATCKVQGRDMVSGNWSLLILGDNGLKGKPFAYQRDFALNVAPQRTTTVSTTCIYTFTEKPTRTIASTYTLATTSTIPNHSTLTRPAATHVLTLRPKPSTVQVTSTDTLTFTTWTRIENRSTAVVTPLCTVPSKPLLPDPQCKILPTIKPAPQGVGIGKEAPGVVDRAINVAGVRKRFQDLRAASSHIESLPPQQTGAPTAAPAPSPPPAAGGDQPVLTITAPYPINSTTTTTLPAKTIQVVFTSTSTLFTTAAPRTVLLGTAVSTVSVPPATETQWHRSFTRVYDVQTMAVAWTWTTTRTVPAAETTRCRMMGGRFGDGVGEVE